MVRPSANNTLLEFKLIELIETTTSREAGLGLLTCARDLKKNLVLLAPYQISLGLAGTGKINSVVHGIKLEQDIKSS